MTKKLFVKTYGCQMNIYDSEQMVNLLKPLGYAITENADEADMAILNTCHIREKAEQKVYSDLGRLRQTQEKRRAHGADMLIAVGGCVGQAEGAEIIRNAPYVEMVFGPQTYHRLPEMIAKVNRARDQKQGKRGVVDTDFPLESKFDLLPAASPEGASAFLSIQEGCDKFCTFCVVPYTRGSEYSRPVAHVLKDAENLVTKGVCEITLLGQNVNAYHGEHNQTTWSLGRLIREMADRFPSLKRIRYTTSHPRDMDDELIQAHGDVPQLMPFLHLPVQSGSNKILEAMNRKHTHESYLDIINLLRKKRPDMAFSSDFIVGFPGETDQDFNDTLQLIRAVKYAQCFSFKYSPRPGTPASAMTLQVPETVKAERLSALQELVNIYQVDFNQAMIGTIQPVLFDKPSRFEGKMMGKSPYMQTVHTDANERLYGKIVDVCIKSVSGATLIGDIVTQEQIVAA